MFKRGISVKMKQTVKILIPIIVMLICVFISVDCSAAVDKYDIIRNPKLIIQKEAKIRLKCSKEGKFKWKSSNNKILTVNKKGIVKVKKLGMAKITAINRKGKKYVCKIIVKKKIKKATQKNVTVKIRKVHDKGVDFVFINNSDESLIIAHRYIGSVNVKGDNSEKGPEEVMAQGVLPYIYVSPRSKYKGTYSFSMTEMASGEYRLIFETRGLGTFPTKELNFTPFAFFSL